MYLGMQLIQSASLRGAKKVWIKIAVGPISPHITACTRWFHLSDARKVTKFPQVAPAGERNGHAEEQQQNEQEEDGRPDNDL
jgi:hypothetical protein